MPGHKKIKNKIKIKMYSANKSQSTYIKYYTNISTVRKAEGEIEQQEEVIYQSTIDTDHLWISQCFNVSIIHKLWKFTVKTEHVHPLAREKLTSRNTHRHPTRIYTHAHRPTCQFNTGLMETIT